MSIEKILKQGALNIIRNELETLKKNQKNDFVTLGIFNQEYNEIRWRIAYGALSDRYRAIAVHMGKGIAGKVVRTGRLLQIDSFPENVVDSELEYPIMIVEKLKSAVAFPVGEGKYVFGVLLVGSRTFRKYSAKEVEEIKNVAQLITKTYSEKIIPFTTMEAFQEVGMSPLERYFQEKQSNSIGTIECQILDQLITKLPDSIQIDLIEMITYIIHQYINESNDLLRITIGRTNDRQISFELILNKRLNDPYRSLSIISEKINAVNGSVEMYNETRKFRMILYLPLELSSIA